MGAQPANCGKDSLGIAIERLLENGSERGPRILRINIDASGQNPLMRNVSSTQIKSALDRKMSFIFDLLRDEFPEDDLFGEVLASHDDRRVGVARGERDDRKANKNNAVRPVRPIHVRPAVVA